MMLTGEGTATHNHLGSQTTYQPYCPLGVWSHSMETHIGGVYGPDLEMEYFIPP